MTPRERALETIFGDRRFEPGRPDDDADGMVAVSTLTDAIAEAEQAAREEMRERAAKVVERWSPATANTDAYLRERGFVAGAIRSLTSATTDQTGGSNG